MDFIFRLAEEFLKKHKRLNRYRRVFAVIAAVVVFATTYELILPAITMDKRRAADTPGVEVGVAADSFEEEAAENESGESVEEENAGEESEETPEAESADPAGTDADSENGNDGSGDSADTEAASGHSTAGSAETDLETAGDHSEEGGTEAGSSDDAKDKAENADHADTADTGSSDQTDASADTDGKNTETTDSGISSETVDPADAATTDPGLIVPGETITTYPATLVFEGKDYTITATFDEAAGLPADVRLDAVEILPDVVYEDENGNPIYPTYEEYYEKAVKAVEKEKKLEEQGQTVTTARFFDITFLDADGFPVEPKAPVSIAVKYKDALSAVDTADTMAVHFDVDKKKSTVEEPAVKVTEVIDTKTQVEEVRDKKTSEKKEEISQISFDADKFSVYGILGTETITTYIITESGDTLQATVEVTTTKDAARFEGLRVKELTEDDEEYWTAYNAVVAEKKNDENFDEDTFGFFAADIALLDENGEEFEPEGTVNVKMELISLPADAETLTSSMEVQHIAKKDGVVEVQTVATTSDLKTIDDVITAQFDVESFSTFTLTWTGDGSSEVIPEEEAKAVLNINSGSETFATVNIHYVDVYGNNITSPFTTAVNGDNPVTIEELLNVEIAGYEYQGAYYGSYTNESQHGDAVATVSATRTSEERESSGVASRTYSRGEYGTLDAAQAVYGTTTYYRNKNLTGQLYWRQYTSGRNRDNFWYLYTDNSSNGSNNRLGNNSTIYYKTSDTQTYYTTSVTFSGESEIETVESDATTSTAAFETGRDIYLVYESTDTSLKSATIHYGTYSGSTFTEFGNDKLVSLDASASTISLPINVSGYSYSHAYYLESSESAEQITIDPILYKNDDIWEVNKHITNADETTSKERGAVANGSHIYVVYSDPVTHGQSGDDVEGPKTEKTVTENDDGTYTIQLDVEGTVKHEEHSTGANVLIILDRTYSMAGAMGSTTRWEAAIDAIDTLIETLSTGDNANNDIEYGIVGFSNDADSIHTWTGSERQYWTSSASTFKTYVDGLNHKGWSDSHGTNWEAGLLQGQTPLASDNRDSDQTYVIFVTDGEPNAKTSSGGTVVSWAETRAKQITALPKISFYGVFCGTDDGAAQVQSLVTAAGGVKAINGTDDATLKSEFASIAQTIISNLGSSGVSVDDGVPTLSSVSATTAGEAGGFEYYKATGENPADSDFSPWENAPGATYSSDNGVTWDLSSVGALADKTTYRLKFTVWPSQAAYDLIADLNNGLLSYGDDYTYTDSDGTHTISGESYKKYVKGNKDNGYYMLTNTHLQTTFTYDGETYTDPSTWNEQEMPLPTETLYVKKIWNNPLDDHLGDDDDNGVELYLTKDGENYLYGEHAIKVKPEGDGDLIWETEEPIYISCGSIIKDESTHKYYVKEDGHDYEIAEPASFAYYWDLTSEIYHPMVINGVAHYLIRNDKATGTDGEDYYIINSHKYVLADSGDHILTATNDRRSNLNLQKVISDLSDDQGADRDTFFKYTISVENANIEQGSVEDIHSNYYTWFSVYDPDKTYREGDDAHLVDSDTLVSTNVTPEPGNTGYFYAPSGADFTVEIKEGWNLRILNMPLGTEYSIEETNIPSGFSFAGCEGSAKTYVPDDEGIAVQVDETYSPSVSGNKITGTIAQSNREYQLRATNKWEPSDKTLTVKKSWNSGTFVTTHGTVRVALYRNGEIIEGSVKKIAAPAASVSYNKITSLENLEVREVIVTSTGTGEEEVTTVTPVNANGVIAVAGETTSLGNNATDTYIVTYTTGTATEGTRTDTITNTMPQLTVNKQDMKGSQLAGAKFKLTGEDGETALTGYGEITSTDAESGNLLNGIYLSNGTYYLVETDPPSGYNKLTYKIKLVVSDDNKIITAVSDPGTMNNFDDQTADNKLLYTFKVLNSDGAVLPHTGGTGRPPYALGGIFLAMTSALMYVFRMRRRERRVR